MTLTLVLSYVLIVAALASLPLSGSPVRATVVFPARETASA
jgi:hypothetical protein